MRTVVAQLPVRQGYPPRSAPPADLPRRVLVRLPAIVLFQECEPCEGVSERAIVHITSSFAVAVRTSVWRTRCRASMAGTSLYAVGLCWALRFCCFARLVGAKPIRSHATLPPVTLMLTLILTLTLNLTLVLTLP